MLASLTFVVLQATTPSISGIPVFTVARTSSYQVALRLGTAVSSITPCSATISGLGMVAAQAYHWAKFVWKLCKFSLGFPGAKL